MNMKKLVSILAGMTFCGMVSAQSQTVTKQDNGWFNHVDIAFTAGTTGLGFDLAAPMTEWAQLRMGGSFMPKFKYKMTFGVEAGTYIENPSLSPEENEKAKNELLSSNFKKMADVMESFTGIRPEPNVDMIGDPKMNNFKLLVDVFPFKNNRHWHVTTGFYYGDNTVAEAYNTTECATSLNAVSMYQLMYRKAISKQDLIEYNGSTMNLPPEFAEKFYRVGAISIPLGKYAHDVTAQEDIYYASNIYASTGQRLHKKGDIMFQKGDVIYHEGETFRMTPDENCMVKAKAMVNRFKPYLGFGYSTSISNDDRTKVSVDAGVLFWGGKPEMMTRTQMNVYDKENNLTLNGVDADGKAIYQEVDMCRDLKNINGKVGTYIDLAKSLTVYPVVSIRLSHRIF